MGAMSIGLGLVALLQGTAWLGRAEGRRRLQGAVLAPIGAAMLVLGLLHLLIPEVWDTSRAEAAASD